MRVSRIFASIMQVVACAGLALSVHVHSALAVDRPGDPGRPGVPARPGWPDVPRSAAAPQVLGGAYGGYDGRGQVRRERRARYGLPPYGAPPPVPGAHGYPYAPEVLPYAAPPPPPPEPPLSRAEMMYEDLARCHAMGVTSLIACLRDRHSSVAIRRLEACIRSSRVPDVPDEARACLAAGRW